MSELFLEIKRFVPKQTGFFLMKRGKDPDISCCIFSEPGMGHRDSILKFFSSVKRQRHLHYLPIFSEPYHMALKAGVLRLKTAKHCETTAI